MTRLLFFIGFCSPFLAYSQLEFHRSSEIPVHIAEESLRHAWSAGLNSSQWSNADFNDDDHEDIFIFDRTADKLLIFLNDPFSDGFVSDFEYIHDFPEVKDWAIMRDFNCDGRADLFTHSPGGIAVYENTGSGSFLDFTLRTSLLESYYDFGTNPFYSNIYVSSVDVPSIDDFDGDGDIDIHTFTLAGQTIEYHENFGAQIGDCDSLAFELRNRCYGMMGEDAVSPNVYIGQDYIDGDYCTFNIIDPDEIIEGNKSRHPHSGSSICVFDYDGNGQKDMLIGDITASDMALVLIEDRGAMPDSAIALEVGFPQADVPVDLHIFNSAFYIDADQDGVRDLVVSPSNANEGDDTHSNWFYKNYGSDDGPDLQLQTTAYLQEEMIDLGTLSMPRILDYNVDGLPDLVVSNRGVYSEDGTYTLEVWLFKNIGTETYPIFERVTDNFQGMNDLGFGDHLGLTFGDLDNDDDIDMIAGDGTGALHYFENTAAPLQEVEYQGYTTLSDGGNDLDLGATLIPQLFDLDDDDLLDLLVGERNGNINFMHNVGSQSEAEFDLIEDSIGDILTDITGNLIGYSAPWFFYNDLGDIEALIGTETGQVYYLSEVDPDPSSTWIISDSSAFGIYNGKRSCPVLFDIDFDGMPDIINGNISGGLGLYMGGAVPSSTPDFAIQESVFVYPNPSSSTFTISFKSSAESWFYSVIDVAGRTIIEGTHLNTEPLQVDLSNMSDGVYHLVMSNERARFSKALLKH